MCLLILYPQYMLPSARPVIKDARIVLVENMVFPMTNTNILLHIISYTRLQNPEQKKSIYRDIFWYDGAWVFLIIIVLFLLPGRSF
ncbi:hypothetical protein MTBBW1_600007 [Desulfamplus magnetovallimortis]|uniref:Uncharacterized protein n=1 Tax=Desulfamplus magnetovallimortis TaxID=1246637 RepID=A0A1W1HI45_9BACT|nr:hypothetical protein MTBBW1_600007 [Desulfamplus magnetovallimortis]